MKKLLFPAFLLFVFFFFSCKKNDTTTPPDACIKATILDSSKIRIYDSLKVGKWLNAETDPTKRSSDSVYFYTHIDSLVATTVDSATKQHIDSFFIVLTDSQVVYKQTVYFNFCNGTSKYVSIYTGVAGQVLADSIGAPVGGTGLVVSGNYYAYKYTSAGTYKAAIVTTNISDYGNDVQTARAKIVFILK